MKSLGIVLLLFLFIPLVQAHNVKIIKNQSSDLDTTGIDAAINNESYINDSDTFIEGSLGYSRSTSSLDQSITEDKNLGVSFITPSFLSLNAFTSQHDNSTQELKTRNIGLEIGKKFFYGPEDNDFRTSFGGRLKTEKINLDQSRTFPRRKFEFGIEQSSTGLSLSWTPLPWFEVSGSYYRYKYSEDVDAIATRLKSSELISNLFSNIKNTINTLSESSRSFSIRLLPYQWIDTTLTRTYSEDLVSDSQFYVDSVDFGFYYFSHLFFFLTVGENFTSADSSKSKFSEIAVQLNF